MTTFLKPFLILGITLSCIVSISAQEKVVILYNNNPVKVELDGDRISSFEGDAPARYMEGYNLDKSNQSTVTPPNSFVESAENGNTQRVNTTVNTTSNTVVSNSNYDVVANEHVSLEFSSNYATLSSEIINNLNIIAKNLRQRKFEKVRLTGYRVTGKPTSEQLTKNRLKAAISYLKIKGVAESQINTSVDITDTEFADLVTVYYMN